MRSESGISTVYRVNARFSEPPQRNRPPPKTSLRTPPAPPHYQYL
jgi:hypothetical protein